MFHSISLSIAPRSAGF